MEEVTALHCCSSLASSCHAVLCSQVYILKKNEGGRHTPFVNNYSPQLFTRTASVSTAMMLPDGI